MNLLALGISHHHTPVELREKLAFSLDSLGTVLPEFRDKAGLDELIILSTCNRVEIYATGQESLTNQISKIKSLLSSYRNIPISEFNNEIYMHHGSGAVKHLFRVSSSLDSMVIGESQILGQVKEAYEIAQKAQCTGPLLNALFQQSFNVAKTIRSTTNIAKGAISISSVAVELAEKIFDSFKDHKVMIIGAGETGELTLKHLIQQGVQSIIVTNRHFERAVQTATAYHGEAVRFEEFLNHLEDVDIIISSTGAPEILLHKDDIVNMMPKRRYKPIFLIDIAVPRDIESSVNTLDNVFLYNIDDLEQIVSQNIQGRTQEIVQCEQIIDQEVKEFLHWYSELEVVPIIRKLSGKVEEIRQREVSRILNQLPELTEDERNKIQSLSQRITGQLLHGPIEKLKLHVRSGNGYSYAEALNELFELRENGNIAFEKGIKTEEGHNSFGASPLLPSTGGKAGNDEEAEPNRKGNDTNN